MDGHRLQRRHRHQEDQGEPDDQDVERHLVGGLLAARPLDQGDHPIEERLARPRGDPDHDPIGQDDGAAGHRAAVPARLTEHRSRLAGDRRLVDRGDPLDNVAVAGDDPAGLDDTEVADLQLAGRDPVDRAVRSSERGHGLLAGTTQGVGLGLAPSATASAKLANSTVSHSHRAIERTKALGRTRNAMVVARLPTSTVNMPGARSICRGSSFTNASIRARCTMAGSSIEDPGRVRTLGGRVSGGGATATVPPGTSGSSIIPTILLAWARYRGNGRHRWCHFVPVVPSDNRPLPSIT